MGGDARGEARGIVGWVDVLENRSEPDHVEVLLAGSGRVDEARSRLDHLEWRGRTLPRSWIDAVLPRARALVRAADGDVVGGPRQFSTRRPRPSGRFPFEAARQLLVRGQLERRANRKLAARASLTSALTDLRRARIAAVGAARARGEIARIGLRHRRAGKSSPKANAGSPSSRPRERPTERSRTAAFVSPKTSRRASPASIGSSGSARGPSSVPGSRHIRRRRVEGCRDRNVGNRRMSRRPPMLQP